MLLNLSAPFVMGAVRFQTSVSIGVGLFPSDGTDADTLLRHADLAMYCAKEDGRGCVRFYDENRSQNGKLRETADNGLGNTVP